VARFANALGLQQFDLNGHSFSTSVAVFVALYLPARVRRLVLTCASTYRSENERQVVRFAHHLLGLWVRLRRPWMGQVRFVYRTLAKRFFYRLPADDALLRESVQEFLRMDRRTAVVHANDVVKIPYHAALRRVAVPTLVVGARQDAIMPTAGTPYLADLIPNSRLTWIEQCGHLPMLEQPEHYHRLLREFLAGEP
jgi:pimeloyl-ACP methyl ester carboxylesterase